MKKVKSSFMRIDEEMAEMLKEFAKNNEMSIRQASKEIAKISKINLLNKKIIKELKF